MKEDDLPFRSNNFSTDLKMIRFCESNYHDKRCGCLNLPKNIYKFSKSSIVPYYCWFSECKKSDVYLTTEIIDEQKLCRLNICEINIDDVNIIDGKMIVENDCSSTINPTMELSNTFVSTNIYDIPDMIISFLIPTSFVILILLWKGL